tara:strand:+ start:252 stop:389 length:138 start_codon:yes stop_codon:yes gene_type:complete
MISGTPIFARELAPKKKTIPYTSIRIPITVKTILGVIKVAFIVRI